MHRDTLYHIATECVILLITISWFQFQHYKANKRITELEETVGNLQTQVNSLLNLFDDHSVQFDKLSKRISQPHPQPSQPQQHQPQQPQPQPQPKPQSQPQPKPQQPQSKHQQPQPKPQQSQNNEDNKSSQQEPFSLFSFNPFAMTQTQNSRPIIQEIIEEETEDTEDSKNNEFDEDVINKDLDNLLSEELADLN